MELGAIAPNHNADRGLNMAAINSVRTIALVAQDLDIDEDVLADIAYPNLEPEDGRLWIYDTDREVMGFTPAGVDALEEIIADLFPHLLKR